MRACPACGASNGPTDDFCGNCGAYLGWSDTAPGPSGTSTEGAADAHPDVPGTGPEPSASEPSAPGPSSPGPRPTSDETVGRSTDRTPDRTSGDDGTAPAPVSTPETPAPAPGPAPAPPTASPPPPSPTPPRTPAPPPPSTPPPSSVPPVLPVRPARPVAPRPVVRPATVPDEAAGEPCPACGVPNLPERRFCRRCAAPLRPAERPDPLPWWRTVWPFRRRVRASSGRGVRLLVILAVVAALCAGGVLLLPAGRALFEDTRDKLGKAKPVTPVDVEASAAVPRHPVSHTLDGLSNTFWGVPAPGASVTYTFRKPFRLVDLIITNGASASPQPYARQARALRMDLVVTTSDGEKHNKTIMLSDKPGPQTIQTGFSDTKSVRLVLRSPAGLTSGRHIALAEVEFFQRG